MMVFCRHAHVCGSAACLADAQSLYDQCAVNTTLFCGTLRYDPRHGCWLELGKGSPARMCPAHHGGHGALVHGNLYVHEVGARADLVPDLCHKGSTVMPSSDSMWRIIQPGGAKHQAARGCDAWKCCATISPKDAATGHHAAPGQTSNTEDPPARKCPAAVAAPGPPSARCRSGGRWRRTGSCCWTSA